ncbi:MAG: glutamate racemase [Proteobacteria bacterium]|nr:glutamate racemase [Pseudomonadota bacterium]
MGSGAPIGVFDSGVGGLTVLKALCAALPTESFVYLGDTARLPYGTKSAATVTRYSVRAADMFADYGVKCLVVACNTVSAAALPAVRERLAGVPVIGVVEPGAQAACEVSPSGRIAVIATEGTVRRGAYQSAILRLRPQARVSAQAAPLFVALAEEGLCSGEVADSAARHYLGPMFRGDLPGGPPDTLVLGCTHFPMLAAVIRAALPAGVAVVDSATTTAAQVRSALQQAGLAAQLAQQRVPPLAPDHAAVRLLATDDAERFARVGSRFLERPISGAEVELVDL